MSDDALAVRDRLDELERVIERGMQTFVEVGAALHEIRERWLYRAAYATFEEYCKARWGWTIRRAQQMMQAASVVGELQDTNHGSPLPANERVARELARLPELSQRQAAWQEATRDRSQPTAAAVRAVVRRVESPEPEPVRALVKAEEVDTVPAMPKMHESPLAFVPVAPTRPIVLPTVSTGDRQSLRIEATNVRRGLPKRISPERLAVAVADDARELRLTREWAAWAKDWILRLDAALQALEDAPPTQEPRA